MLQHHIILKEDLTFLYIFTLPTTTTLYILLKTT